MNQSFETVSNLFAADKARYHGLGSYISGPSQTFQDAVQSLAKSIIDQPALYDEAKVRDFFFNVVPLSSNKSQIFGELGTKQGHTVQAILSPELGALRAAKDPTHDTVDKKMARKKEKANLAIKLGIVAEKAWTGHSGSVVLTDLKGKKLGLFKPSEENISYYTWFKIVFFKYAFGVESYWLTDDPLAGVRAEVAAYKTAVYNGSPDLVPATSLFAVGGTTGSFQLWAKKEEGEEIGEFGNIEKAFESRTSYTDEEIEMFQEFVDFDFAIGNLDRHKWNWMVRYILNGEGKPVLTKLVIIDHDRSFIQRNPSWRSLCIRHQYAWGNLKIARIPFTEKAKARLKEKYSPEKVESLISSLKADAQQTKELITPDVENRMKERAEVLYKIGCSAVGSNYTPAELRHYRTEQSIDDLLVRNKRKSS